MCLAAVAHHEDPPKTTTPESDDQNMGVWDSVWSAAMRRLNLPAVCRAACHAAQVLLQNNKNLLSSRNMRDEIEGLAKELVVQGPPMPYDSVCGFLALCMRIASQDVSLYRLHLEDKTLHWLMDNWRPSGAVRRLPPYCVQDILFLLGHICSFSRGADVVCDILLPDHTVVDAMKEQQATRIIRDYSLYATLPRFRKPEQSLVEHKRSADTIENRDLVASGVREQRISAFFLKFLDEIVQDREAQRETIPGMEKIRSIIDLYINGIQWNRRVIQAACKVLMLVLPLLSNQRWLLPEQAFMLAGFAPLYLVEPRKDDHEPWEALLPPGRLTGIRTEILRTLVRDGPSSEARAKESRRMLQQTLFRSSDVGFIS
jgi:serine-protein kinase ATM